MLAALLLLLAAAATPPTEAAAAGAPGPALAGDTRPGSVTAAVPMAEEPYHRLLFENPRAAVYDVVLPPGALMRYHRHPTNHLAVVIAGGTLRNEVVGGGDSTTPTAVGSVVTERATGPGGTVVYIPAGPPHRQSNVGTTPVHFVAAEVLAPAPAGTLVDGGVARPGCTVTLDNAVIVAWRCHLAPGARLAALDARVPYLRVALGAGTVAVAGAGGAEVETALAAGTVTWHEGGIRADVRNRGDAPVDLVEIAWRPAAKPLRRTADVPTAPGVPPQ